MFLSSMPERFTDGEVDVCTLRRRIDVIDRDIIELLHARRKLSRQVQHGRTDAGGPRLVPAREAEITETYRASFGTAGDTLASALLRICRGAPDA